MAALAPYLSTDQLTETLAAARQITDEHKRVQVLVGLAPHLPTDQQHQAWTQALAAARQITDEHKRVQVLVGLVPHLSTDQQHQAWTQALAAACEVTDELWRAQVLAALAPHLPTDQLAEALVAARQITDDYKRALVLAALAPQVPKELVAVWTTISKFSDASQQLLRMFGPSESRTSVSEQTFRPDAGAADPAKQQFVGSPRP